MTEPIYEYVRGQGWVITNGETCTMSCGTVVRLEHRMPNLGEPWLRSAGWLYENYTPKYERFKECLLGDWSGYADLFRQRSGHLPSGPHGTVTVIKL